MRLRLLAVALLAATCLPFVSALYTINKKTLPNAVTEQFQEVGTDTFTFSPTWGGYYQGCATGVLGVYSCFFDPVLNGWTNGEHKLIFTIEPTDDLIGIVPNGHGDGKFVFEYDENNQNDDFEFELYGLEDDIKRTATYEGHYKVTLTANTNLGGIPPYTQLVTPSSTIEWAVSIKDNDKGLASVVLSDDFPYPPDIAEGRSQNYDIVLQSIPIDGSSVFVRFASNNATLTVTPDFVEFVPSNWNVIQKVAVGAVDDTTTYPSPHAASFSMVQESTDPNFDDITLPDITVTIEDNDFLANLGYSAITWKAETLSGQGSNIKIVATMTICVVKASMPAGLGVGDTVSIEAEVAVGGEVSISSPIMTVVAKDPLYMTLTLVIEHTFINSAADANAPKVLSISHCCRQRELLNNKDSSRTNMVLADLDFVAESPVVGVIPVIHLPTDAGNRRRRALNYYGNDAAAWPTSRSRRSSGLSTFQIPAYSNGNPMKFTLGTTTEYGTSLLGSPYGLEIDSTTGIVTWDTDLVSEGLWNLVVIVEDLVTFGEITVELMLNVYAPSADETPDLSCVKCATTQYLDVGTDFESAFGASCGGSSCTAELQFVGGLPAGGAVDGNTFKWTPTADQTGAYVHCFQAKESIAGHISSPQCVTMVVVDALGNIPSLTVPATAQFAAGADGPAVIASTAALTLAAGSSVISEITVELAKVKDAGFEELTVDPSAVSLALGIAQPRPETLIVSGTADIAVFQSFLRNVRYTNSLSMPTVGDRTLLLKARTNDGFVSLVKTVTLTVSIQNVAPVFHLDKNDTGLDYSTVFYRSGDPVLISGEALLTDADSNIAQATVTLAAIPDGVDELLMSVYEAPPKLAGGGLFVSGRVDQKFGTLPLEPEATASITVDTASEGNAIVQDVNVIVDISHSYIGDVQLFIEHNGRVEELVSRPGGAACAADDMYNTVFDQSSDVGLARSDKDAGACAGYTRGVYGPSGNLDNFNFMKADGEWTLRAKDLQLESDDGMIKQWGIALRTTLTNVSEVASITPQMKLTPGLLTSTHSLYVGASGRVEDLNVGLNLISSHLPNTKVEITSPVGTTVVLFDGAVKCSKSNFGLTVFDDEAADSFSDPGCKISSLDELAATIQPIEPLSAFVGERIIGTWTMTVSATTVDDLEVDFLGWSIDMNSQPNVARSYDSSTGTLTLTGPDTPEEFDTILSSIAYKNTKLNPTEAARSITIVVTDDAGASSVAATTAMAIHHLDELDLININEDDYTYTGDTKMCGEVCTKDISIQKFNDVSTIIEKAVPSDNSVILDGTSWTRSSVSDDLGIAIIIADDTDGEWQFSIDSGSNWTPMNDDSAGVVSPTSALTLHGKPEGQNLIRFVPNLDYHETATFDFVIWEMGDTDVSGQKLVDTTARDDISMASTTVTITVDPVNDSPIVALVDGFDMIDMGLIDEDIGGAASNAGARVSDLLVESSGTIYTDVDAATPSGLDAEHGIAVIHVENSHGYWQWMCDVVNGVNVGGIWTNFVGGLEGNRIVALPTASKATLLGPGCSVRFEPELNYNTFYDLNGDDWTVRNPYIEFKAWDNTGVTLGLQGSPGVDSRQESYRDWHDPFSNSTLEAEVSVDTLNDLPELTIHGADVTEYAGYYIEDADEVALVDADAVLIADVDHARMNKLTITLVSDVDMGPDTTTIGDVLSFNVADTSLKVVSEVNADGELVYTIEPIDASDKDSKKLEDFALVLKSAKYSSVLEEPRVGERRFSLQVFDEEDEESTAVFSIITVVSVNDAPVLGLGTSVLFKYTEGTGGQAIVGVEGSIDDNDNTTMSSMTVTLVARPDGTEEFLSVDTMGGVTVTYSDSTGVLFIDGEASVAHYISMLQAVKYTNQKFDFDNGNPDTTARKITYVINDGADVSAEVSTSLSFEGVNDKPYVSFTVDPKVFVEEEGEIALFTDTVLYDIDSETLSFIDVEIVSPPDGDDESLSFKPFVAEIVVGGQTTIATYEPTSSNFANGKLRFSGLASVDLFSKILASVTYLHVGDEPDTADRIIRVTANDGELTSDVFEQTVTIELRNDAPTVNLAATLEDVAILEDDSGATNFTTKFMLTDASGNAFVDIISDDDNSVVSDSGSGSGSGSGDSLGQTDPYGLAIISVDGSNGVWEYMLVGTSDVWVPLNVAGETSPLTTVTNALLVTVEDSTHIRFVPDLDFYGSAELSFVAWDGSRVPQRAAGSRSDATYTAATGAFSEASATFTITVGAVNDSPIINDITPVALIPIIEDDLLLQASWNDVSEIAKSIAATDVDGPDVLGVAIIFSNTVGRGVWQYSVDAGVSFVDIADDVSPSAAVLLSGSVPATTYLRFVPVANIAGDVSLTLAAWDETSFTTGVQDISDPDFVIGPFSPNTIDLELEIMNVNDSPVLLTDTQPEILVEDEIPFKNTGLTSMKISTLFPTALSIGKTTVYEDVDEFSVLGVVVVGLDNTHGDWSWECPPDALYYPFVGGEIEGVVYKADPTVNHGTVLGPECRIRFGPDTDFNSEYDLEGELWATDVRPSITFKAWDRTGDSESTAFGTSGIDTMVPGGAFDEFSDETAKFYISIESVNDMPVTAVHSGAGNYLTSYTEDQADSVPIINSTGTLISDPDNAKLKSVVVTLTNAEDNTDEVLEWDSDIAAIQGAVTRAGNLLTLTLTPASGTTEYAHQFTAALQSIAYKNTAVEATPSSRIFQFYAVDAQDGQGPTVSSEVEVVPFNDKPVLDLNGAATGRGYPVEYQEGVLEQSIVDAAGLTIEDNDNTTLMSLTVTLEEAPDGDSEILDVRSGALVVPSDLTKVVVDGVSVTISGEASKATYQAIARSITYSNKLYDHTLGNPTLTARKVKFVLSDGVDVSDEVFSSITFAAVNDEPFVDLNGDAVGEDVTVTFVEEEGEVRLFDDDLNLYDIDTDTLEYVKITITNALDGAAEKLDYKPYIVQDIDGDQTIENTIDPTDAVYADGTLTIRGLSTTENFRKIVASVTYDNTKDEPSPADRTISIVAFDGDLSSVARTATVQIALRNDAPSVGLTVSTEYVLGGEEDTAMTIEVANLLSSLPVGTFVDDDLPTDSTPLGIAIVQADETNGSWSVINTADQSDISVFSGSSVNSNNAFLVDASAATLKFVPNQNFHGDVSLKFLAWDKTGSNAGYTYTNAAYSETGQFSEEWVELKIQLAPVNDAPVLLTGVAEDLIAIDEDDYTSINRLNDLADVVTSIAATDVDGEVPTGIAVFEQDTGNGEWQYTTDGGATFVSFPDLQGNTMAVVLSGAVGSTSYIRFVPALNFHGTAWLKVMSWDETDLGPSGSTVDYSGVDATTGSISTNGATLTVEVHPINDAPVVVDGATLTQIAEDDSASNIVGDAVSTLVVSEFSDVDWDSSTSENLIGIAVVGVDRRFGDWSWQCDEDAGFSTFVGGRLFNGDIYPENPEPTKATLLSADCKIRFVPTENFNTEFDENGAKRADSDKPFLTYIGWDRFATTYSYYDEHTSVSFTKTLGASQWPGQISVDSSIGRGGTSSFSSEVVRMTVEVESVNDVPVLELGNGPSAVSSPGNGASYDTAFVEDGLPVAIVDTNAYTLSDVDNAWFASLTLTIDVKDPGYDVLTFDTNPSEVTVTKSNKPGQCFDWHGTFMDLDGNGCGWYKEDTARCRRESGRSRRSEPRRLGSNGYDVFDPVTGSRRRSANRRNPLASTRPSTTEEPRVGSTTTSTTTTEEPRVGSTTTSTTTTEEPRVDPKCHSSCREDAGDAMYFRQKSISDAWTAVCAMEGCEGCPECDGVYTVKDTMDESSSTSTTTDAPSGYVERETPVVVMTLQGLDYNTLVQSEDAIAIITTIKVQIVEHIHLHSPNVEVEKVELSAASAGVGVERLRRSEGGGIIAEIFLKSDSSTDEDAEDIVAQLQAMVDNDAGSESGSGSGFYIAPLMIQLLDGTTLVFDGAAATTVFDAIDIWTGEHAMDVCCACGGGHNDVNGVDTYTGNDGSFDFVVERELSSDASAMTYTISNPAWGNDAPSVSDIAALAKKGERGYENEMPVTAYASMLSTAKFYSRHSEPSNATRTISVVANDGLDTAKEFSSIRVQLLASTYPVIDLKTYKYTFTEGSGPQVVADSNALVVDEDHGEYFLMSKLYIFDIRASSSLGDVFSVDTAGTAITFDDSNFKDTGVVVLEGPAEAADFAAVLKTLSFDSVEEEPEIGTRVYGVQAIDANGLESNVARFSIDVLPLNDQTPTFDLYGIQAVHYEESSDYAGGFYADRDDVDISGAATIHFLEDTDHKKYLGNVRLVDDDSGDLNINMVTFKVLGMQNSEEKLMALNNVASINVTWDAAEGILTLLGPAKVVDFNLEISTIVYENSAEEPLEFNRTIEMRAYDGDNVGAADITIWVEVVNDVPVVAYDASEDPVLFIEGNNDGLDMFTSLTIEDNDHTNFESATLQIEGAADLDLDVNFEKLVLDTAAAAAAGITHAWDADTFTLGLSGLASRQQYLAVLAGVKYTHLDKNPGNPTAGHRTITLLIFDGEDDSNELSFSLVVVPVNDAAIVTTNDFVGDFTEESDGAKVANASLTVVDVDTPLLAYGVVRIVNPEDLGSEALEFMPSAASTVMAANVAKTCDIMCEIDNRVVGGSGSGDSGDSGALYGDVYGSGENDELNACKVECDNEDSDTVKKATALLVLVPKPGGQDGIDAANLEEAFQNVYYTNSMDEPNNTTRDIGFMVFDNDLESSLAYSTMTITMTNDAPEFYVANNTDQFTTTFTEGSAPIEVIDGANIGNVIVDDDHEHIQSLTVKLLGKCAEIECASNSPCDSSGWCLVDSSYEGLYSSSVSDDAPPVGRADWMNTLYDRRFNDEVGVRPDADKIGTSMSTFIKTGEIEIAAVEQLIRDMRYINLDHAVADGTTRKITFVVTDLLLEASKTVSTIVTLSSVNTEPITVATETDTTLTVDEDADATQINVAALFVDDVASSYTIDVSTLPNPYGEVVALADGASISFTPEENDNGNVTFGVKLCDVEMICSAELAFTFVIVPVNDAPYAVNNTYTILEDTLTEIDFSKFFIDIEDYHFEPRYNGANVDGYQPGNISWYTAAGEGYSPDSPGKVSTWNDWSHQAIKDGSAGLYSLKGKSNKNSEYGNYVPAVPLVYFRYCDSVSECTIMHVEITVENVNDAPELETTFRSDDYQPERETSFGEKDYIEVAEDNAVSVKLRIVDEEDDTTNANGTGPIHVVDADITLEPSHGTAQINFVDGTVESSNDGWQYWQLTFTPDADFFGFDLLEVTVTDSEGASVKKNLTILVQAVRDLPRLGFFDNLAVIEDTPKSWDIMNFLIIDPEKEVDGEPLLDISGVQLMSADGTVSKDVITENGGTVSIDTASGELTYAPSEHYFGSDEFKVQVCNNLYFETKLKDARFPQLAESWVTESRNGVAECVEMIVPVEVASKNDAPILPETFEKSVYEDTELRIDMSLNVTDVEEQGNDWFDIVFVGAEPGVTNLGNVTYDRATKEIVYTPGLDNFGQDEVSYKICDQENLCSTGTFIVNVLPVNDPPRILPKYTLYLENNPSGYEVEEDRWNLIYAQGGIYADPDVSDISVEDLQTLMDGDTAPLQIEVLSAASHGEVIDFSKNGYISYHSVNFVGQDQFTIRVCDVCSSLRNEEIRGDANKESSDPACERERELSALREDGGSGDFEDADSEDGCLITQISLRVKNVNDNLKSVDLAGVINTNSDLSVARFCPIDFADEIDDTQSDIVKALGLNPETFGLKNETDINYDSLEIITTAEFGSVEVTAPGSNCVTGNTPSLLYTVTDDTKFGLDTFTYKICDKQSTCTESTVHVYIAKAAPEIRSVVATSGTTGAGTEDDPIIDTDAKYGTGDSFDIIFNMDTNMPPTGTVGQYISGFELVKILNFTQTIAAESTGFHGIWTSASELSVVIDDVGPQEIIIDPSTFVTEIISKPECGPFDVDSQVYVKQEETSFCLKNADQNSLPSEASEQGLESDRGWGGALADLIEVRVRCIESVGTDYLGPGCAVDFILGPALSPSILIEFCGENGEKADECLDLTAFGEGVKVDLSFETQSADDETDANRRATANGDSTKLTLDFTQLTVPAVIPSDSEAFFEAVRAAWRGQDPYRKLADQTASHSGFPNVADALVSYVTSSESPVAAQREQLTAAAALYIEGLNANTPKVDLVSYTGNGATLQKITIRFDRETNTPSNILENLQVTEAGIKALMDFDLDIGTFQGTWTSRTILEIDVVVVNPDLVGVPTITFRDNEDSDGVETGDPCRGANVCGALPDGTGSWGICDRGATSCRASGKVGAAGQAINEDVSQVVVDFNPPDADSSLAGTDASTNDAENAMAGSSSYAFLGLLVLIPVIAGIIYYSSVKKTERAENKRAMKAFLQKKMTWNGDGADGKPVAVDASEMWNRPPGMVAMRSNPDPFLNLSGGTGAAPTAAPKVTDPFAPRAAPSMKLPGITAGLKAPQRGATMLGGKPKVGLSSLPPLKAGGGAGVGASLGPRGTGLPPPKLPPMGRKPGAPIPRQSQVGGRRPGPGNRVAPGGPGGGSRTAFQNIAGRASKGNMFDLARRASNSSFNGEQREDPFTRTNSGGGNRSNSMPRRPNFKAMGSNTINANRMARPNVPPPRGMPGQRPSMAGPMSPPGSMRGRGGGGRGRGMPMAPGRGGGRGMPMSPPGGGGGRGRPSMGGRGSMPMAPRGRGMPGRGRGLAPPRAGMAPPSRGGGAGFRGPSPKPSPKPVMRGMPGGLARPGGPPGAAGASSDPFSRPGPGGPRPGPPGASSDPFSRPGGPNSGAIKPPQ